MPDSTPTDPTQDPRPTPPHPTIEADDIDDLVAKAARLMGDAGTPPTLERLQVVDLQPGDTIIATLAPGTTKELAAAVEYDLMGRYPDNDINVLPPGVSLHVMRPAPAPVVNIHQHTEGDPQRAGDFLRDKGWTLHEPTPRISGGALQQLQAMGLPIVTTDGRLLPEADAKIVADFARDLRSRGRWGEVAMLGRLVEDENSPGLLVETDDTTIDIQPGRVLIIPIPNPATPAEDG